MIKESRRGEGPPLPDILRGTLKGLPPFRLAFGEGIKEFLSRPPV